MRKFEPGERVMGNHSVGGELSCNICRNVCGVYGLLGCLNQFIRKISTLKLDLIEKKIFG